MWIILSSKLGSQVAWRAEVVGWEMIDEALVVSSVLLLRATMVTFWGGTEHPERSMLGAAPLATWMGGGAHPRLPSMATGGGFAT